MLWLKQSTAVTLKIGPFVDETDGKTAETGLTIAQADVRLSMNGGNIVQKNEGTSCTHDELGIYGCPIDTTDTGTLGRLQLWVHESGALPVWHEFMVVPANVWDSFFGAEHLDVNVVEIDDDATAADNLESALDNYSVTRGLAGTALPAAAADAAGGLPISDAGGLDLDTQIGTDIDAILVDTAEIGAAGAGLTAVPWNAAWDAEVQSEAADALTAYDPPTKAEMDTAHALLATEAKQDTIDTVVDAIKAKTDNLPADPADDSDIDAQLAAILADTNELQTDWADGGRLDLILDAITAQAGAGAITFTYTLTSSVDSTPVADADVWVTSDLAGSNVLASGTTDASGEVVFYLDAGTVYVWAQKSGWNFTNPDTETVA